MAILFAVFFVVALNQYKIKMDNNNQIKELKEQITYASKYSEELKEENDYKESDRYIEKIAREQLGMVKPNEIIFIEQNKK